MKKIAKYGVICLIIVIALMLIILGINLYVKSSTKNQIIENNDYSNLKDKLCSSSVNEKPFMSWTKWGFTSFTLNNL